jgi:polyisoprenyl-phosphate glycosyltransferase
MITSMVKNTNNLQTTPFISIIAPFYNEGNDTIEFFKCLIPVLEKISEDYEVICINDGSKDNTLNCLNMVRENNPKIKIINFSRNFGKEAALTAGLFYSKGKIVVPIDSDLQDPPELIIEMVEKWKSGFDVVYAKRVARHGETWLKIKTAEYFYKLIQYLSDVYIPRDVGDFRLMDRKVVDALNRLPERNRFMKGLFAWVGFTQTEIEYNRKSRSGGISKWNYWKLWNFALSGIFMFSNIPLKIWSYIGFIVSGFAFVYSIFRIIRVSIHGIDVPGYDSTIVIILFLGGIQLIGLGVLGEYMARMFDEIKQRPIFIVKEEIGIEKIESNN